MTDVTCVPLREVAGRVQLLVAAGIGGQQPAPHVETVPPADVLAVAQATIERYLQADASAWVALLDGWPRALLGAMLTTVTENDPGFTYLPPRYALSPVSAWHIAAAEDLCLLPALFEHVRRDARAHGIERVSVQVRAGDWTAGALWRSLGLRPDLVMAARHRPLPLPLPLPLAPPVSIRVARPGDEEALVRLAHEEQDFHAHHTASGTLADQPDAPTRREVDHWLAAHAGGAMPTLVAERDGRIVGCCSLSISELPEGAAGRRYYPARHGYIGLTSVTAPARGRGIGRALVRAALEEFAHRGIGPVMLHYVDDNPLSRVFWQRMGFAPFVETLTYRGP